MFNFSKINHDGIEQYNVYIYIYIKIYLIDSESFFFFFCIFKHGDSDIYHIFIISIIHLSCTKVKLILNREQPKLVKFKGESFHAVIIRFVTDRRKKKKKRERNLWWKAWRDSSPNPPVKSKIDRGGAYISLPACDFQSPRMSVHQPPHNLFFSRRGPLPLPLE